MIGTVLMYIAAVALVSLCVAVSLVGVGIACISLKGIFKILKEGL